MSEPTALAAWRAQRLAEETLPSGLPVALRRNVRLIDLAVRGDIPAPLVPQVEQLINQAQRGPSPIEVKDLARHAAVIDLVVRAVLHSPPVADEPDDTHIGIAELSFDDRLWIFNWAHGEASGVATFPGAARERAARGRERLRAAAVQPAQGDLGGLAD